MTGNQEQHDLMNQRATAAIQEGPVFTDAQRDALKEEQCVVNHAQECMRRLRTRIAGRIVTQYTFETVLNEESARLSGNLRDDLRNENIDIFVRVIKVAEPLPNDDPFQIGSWFKTRSIYENLHWTVQMTRDDDGHVVIAVSESNEAL